MGSPRLLTFAEITKVPGEYRSTEDGWTNYRFRVDPDGKVYGTHEAPYDWIYLNPSRSCWNTPAAVFYKEEPEVKYQSRTVYEDAGGEFWARNSLGEWFHGELGPEGFVLAEDEPPRDLKPRPDLSYGFFEKEKPMATNEVVPGRVYQDRNGHLCLKVSEGAWLFDACPADPGPTRGTVVSSHDPSKPCYGGLTPRPDLDIGFFRKQGV